MRSVLLWRHGRTAWNAAGRFQGQLDPPLDDVGIAQAAAAAPLLARRAPAQLATSDLQRAAATAAALAATTGLTAVPDPGLRELSLGSWEGLSRTQVEASDPAGYAAWTAGSGRPGDGETMAELGARVSAAVLACLAALPADGLLVAATHGAAARAAVGVLLELPAEQWWRLQALGNCRWVLLGESPRGWRLVEYNAGVLEPTAPDPVTAPDAEPVGS